MTMKRRSRYHIDVKAAPAPPSGYPAKFKLLKDDDYVKYGHAPFADPVRQSHAYWTPEIITQTWYMAETGAIPISGAGYGGKFAGEGFDGLWFDMSEIVRPTRDGIHGREFISTEVELGGKIAALRFDEAGRLSSPNAGSIQLPIPVIFNSLPASWVDRIFLEILSRAASQLGTLCIADQDQIKTFLPEEARRPAVRITPHDAPFQADDRGLRYVEIEAAGLEEGLGLWSAVSQLRCDLVIGLHLPLSPEAGESAARCIRAGVPVLHFFADSNGRDTSGRHLADALQELHLSLVKRAVRDEVTLVVSGGIAAADHVAKAIACGADLVAVDTVLQAALGCALWADQGGCSVHDQKIEPAWGAQRIVNLMNAWRDQVLEVLGAMGMREIRRLRGEMGRIIRDRDEQEPFRNNLGRRVPMSSYRRLPPAKGAGGDFRWPVELLQSSMAQARDGRPPSGQMEYRVGSSDGGFDRVAFAFELGRDPGDVPSADPDAFDLSLNLNRRDADRPALKLAVPWYGAGMSFGSVSLQVMLARARAAREIGSLVSTGEGGYPEELAAYSDHIITQVATGLFGVREETLQRAPVIELKYAQGAKPGLGGHLLADKNTRDVARLREANQGISLFSPFPFHSVYSVEDHKKHVDWLKTINPTALIAVKVSTPTDVDMVVTGSYYAGAHIVNLDGACGGTGAAPEIAKKSIAMPIEYAIPKAHEFLVNEGIREEITLMASGGLRTMWDVAKAIALGADGAVIGTAELVALGCIRLGRCERGLGCPFGITTTDPEHAKKIDPEDGRKKIVNLYTAWKSQLAGILQLTGLKAVRELRGRTDLLVYLD
ncbi:MAG: glutamate synthase-related protein [Hyphomicrobiales bacterium]